MQPDGSPPLLFIPCSAYVSSMTARVVAGLALLRMHDNKRRNTAELDSV
jgi:hypothetical protein